MNNKLNLKHIILIILIIIVLIIVFRNQKKSIYKVNSDIESGRKFDGLEDIYISHNGYIYIRDAKKIYKFDKNHKLIKSVNRFTTILRSDLSYYNNNNLFVVAYGFYIKNNKKTSDTECVYIVDNYNGKIIMLDSNLEKQLEFGLDDDKQSYFKKNNMYKPGTKNDYDSISPFIITGIKVIGDYVYVVDGCSNDIKVFNIFFNYKLEKNLLLKKCN